MAAAAQRHRRAGAAVVASEFPPDSDDYRLTELTNISSSGGSGSSNSAEDFTLRLIELAKDHPCLYDPNDEHSGSRNKDATARQAVFSSIAASLGCAPHTVATTWSRVKNTFTREQKGQQLQAGEVPLTPAQRQTLQWLNEYNGSSQPRPAAHIESVPSTSNELIFFDGDEGNVTEDVLLEDYQDRNEYCISSDVPDMTSDEIEVGVNSPRSTHSASSLVDVEGSISSQTRSEKGASPRKKVPLLGITASSGPPHPQATHSLTYQPSRIGSNQQQHTTTYRLLPSTQTEVAPTRGAVVPPATNTRRDGQPIRGDVGHSTLTTMIVDTTSFYQNGSQKMYRLVNVADLQQNASIPQGATIMQMPARSSRKRAVPGTVPPAPPTHSSHTLQQLNPLDSPTGLSSQLGASGSDSFGKVGQLGDDLILDDGIGERTVVIDQQVDEEPQSPLLVADSPSGMMMLSGGGRNLHSRTGHSPMMGGSSSRPFSPTGGTLYGGYNNTTQYDADLNFQQFISSRLALLPEDEKAVMKMQIQRILLDARFGQGMARRILMTESAVEDEHLTDAPATMEETQ